MAAETLSRASEKLKSAKRTRTGTPKAPIILAAIESSASETDPLIRELWANLLAQELDGGRVHPEFPQVLRRLSAQDAHVLSQIAQAEDRKSASFKQAVGRFAATFSIADAVISLIVVDEPGSFIHEHLEALNLIRRRDGRWTLTLTGRAFIHAVTDSWPPSAA
jgi:hypothetical protein